MINSIKKIIPLNVKRKILLFQHQGNKYICPFCQYKAKDLALIGFDFSVIEEKKIIGGGQRYAGCYSCGSSDRERLLYVYLFKKINISAAATDMSILHIAPEKSLSNKLMSIEFSKYICGDLFTEGYTYPAHVQNINVLNIPFDKNTFDLVLCNHVLEHIPTDFEAMSEIFRVLKNGGKAILQVPISANSKTTFEDFTITDSKEREVNFGQFDHVRIYGQDYVERLEKCGFKVKRINISNEFEEYGLNLEEDIFVCEKV